MQNYFDSHAHYDDPRFDEGREVLLGSMAEHGVRAIMNVGNATHANLAGIELAKRPENKGKTIVVLLPDTGDRYLSTPLFQD